MNQDTIELDISYKNKKVLAFCTISLIMFLIGHITQIKTIAAIGDILCLMSAFVIFAGILLIGFHRYAYPEEIKK